MTRPTHTVIEMVRDTLRANSGEVLVKSELQGRWLDQHPTAKDGDYFTHLRTDPNYESSLASIKSRFNANIERLGYEETLKDDADRWDRNKLQIRDEREFFKDSREAQFAYGDLRDCFKDSTLYGYADEGFYNLDVTQIVEFKRLLRDAKAGAQRNATELGAELGAAISFNDVALKGTDLLNRLVDLKTVLKEWDTLLAGDALPDKNALTQKAKECARELESCYKAHGAAFSQSTNPFVKYQLLATMRAIGEKVGSQFAARAGAPSFAAMCELIGDVPNRGSNGKPLAKGKDLGAAFKDALLELEKKLAHEDRNLATQLKAKFSDSPDKAVTELDTWANNYKDLSKLTSNVEPLRDSIAKIAFSLGRQKVITDDVLAKTYSAKVKAIGDRYQQTLDGIVSRLQSDIQQCIKNLDS